MSTVGVARLLIQRGWLKDEELAVVLYLGLVASEAEAHAK